MAAQSVLIFQLVLSSPAAAQSEASATHVVTTKDSGDILKAARPTTIAATAVATLTSANCASLRVSDLDMTEHSDPCTGSLASDILNVLRSVKLRNRLIDSVAEGTSKGCGSVYSNGQVRDTKRDSRSDCICHLAACDYAGAIADGADSGNAICVSGVRLDTLPTTDGIDNARPPVGPHLSLIIMTKDSAKREGESNSNHVRIGGVVIR